MYYVVHKQDYAPYPEPYALAVPIRVTIPYNSHSHRVKATPPQTLMAPKNRSTVMGCSGSL